MKHSDHEASLEQRIIGILNGRGPHAIEMDALKSLAAMGNKPFWCALSRLEAKGIVFRWSNEVFKTYVVLETHRLGAWYTERQTVQVNIFDTPRQVDVTRSIPFVGLDDEDEEGNALVTRRNRYRELDHAVA